VIDTGVLFLTGLCFWPHVLDDSVPAVINNNNLYYERCRRVTGWGPGAWESAKLTEREEYGVDPGKKCLVVFQPGLASQRRRSSLWWKR